ncbi:MAG: DUF4013 domain-containing protein [Methanobacterium sp.]
MKIRMFKDALNYPFSGWKSFLILGIIIVCNTLNYFFQSLGVSMLLLTGLSSFGLIFALFIYGYGIRILKSSLTGFDELPEFNSWLQMFIDGFKAIVVGVGYVIPLILILVFASLFLGFTAGIMGANIVMSYLWTFIIIGFLYLILVFPIYLMALANMAFYDDLGAAFEFSEIFSKISSIGWKNFFTWYLSTLIIFFALIFAFSEIEVFFNLISLKIVGTLLTQLVLLPYITIFMFRSAALFYSSKNQEYLVCEKCGGYYKLQPGESPEDFSDKCECGGNLKFVQDLDDNSSEDIISEKQNFKDKLKYLLNNKWNLAFIGVLILVICLVGFTSTQKAVVTNSTLIGTYNVGDINPVNGTVIAAIPSGTSKIRMEYNLSWTQPIKGNSGLTIEGYNVNVTNENLIYQHNSLIYYKEISLYKNDKNKTGTIYLDGSSIKCLVISQNGLKGTIKIYSDKTT